MRIIRPFFNDNYKQHVTHAVLGGGQKKNINFLGAVGFQFAEKLTLFLK